MKWHVLAWPNVDPRVIAAQKAVFEHFDLDVEYTHERVPHGVWMNDTLSKAYNDELVGFFDVDCVPTNTQVLQKAMFWATVNKSFVGVAQVSNHIKPASHVYAAPAFYVMYRDAWMDLNCPTFSETASSDVAENVSYAAEYAGLPYRCLYPTHFEKESRDGAWRLGNYGHYGIGTHFAGGIYHLYQGRFSDNVQLFVTRCSQIIDGTFSTVGMKLSDGIML